MDDGRNYPASVFVDAIQSIYGWGMILMATTILGMFLGGLFAPAGKSMCCCLCCFPVVEPAQPQSLLAWIFALAAFYLALIYDASTRTRIIVAASNVAVAFSMALWAGLATS